MVQQISILFCLNPFQSITLSLLYLESQTVPALLHQAQDSDADEEAGVVPRRHGQGPLDGADDQGRHRSHETDIEALEDL